MCSWQHYHTWGLQAARVTGAEQLTPSLGHKHNDHSQRLAAELGVSPGFKRDRSSPAAYQKPAASPGDWSSSSPCQPPPYRALALASRRTETCLAPPINPSPGGRAEAMRCGARDGHPCRHSPHPSESGTEKAWRAASNGASVHAAVAATSSPPPPLMAGESVC